MSKTAGSATPGYQTSSAASGARPAPVGRTSVGAARIEPEERVSPKESRHPGDENRSDAGEPTDAAQQSNADEPSQADEPSDIEELEAYFRPSLDDDDDEAGPGDGDSAQGDGDSAQGGVDDAADDPSDRAPSEGDDQDEDEASALSEDEDEASAPSDDEGDHAVSEDVDAARAPDEDGAEDEAEDHAEDRDGQPGPVPVIVGSVHSGYSDDEFVPGSPAADDSTATDDSQPSWSRVIATTLRLWLQRRVLGRQDVAGQRRRAMRRRAGAFGVVILVFAAGALTIALAQGRSSSGSHDGGTAAHNARTAKLGTSALAQATTNRQKAAAWVTAQVGSSVIVSCDPLMCTDLQASGFPVGNLMSLGVSAPDPMGSQIVMSTTALRSQFGNRLPDVYAPVVVASFGSGPARVDVRVDAPEGSQAYLVAQRADFLARQAAGKQLLRNKFLHVTGTSRQDIASGHVDSRLLITLAALTGQQHRVYVSHFGDGGPDQVSAPLRTVRIAALIQHQPGKPHTYLTAVLRFLRTEQAPFKARATVLHQATKTLIQIQFAAPSPLGLLGVNATP